MLNIFCSAAQELRLGLDDCGSLPAFLHSARIHFPTPALPAPRTIVSAQMQAYAADFGPKHIILHFAPKSTLPSEYKGSSSAEDSLPAENLQSYALSGPSLNVAPLNSKEVIY